MQWNLMKLRRERGITQEDIANLLGISVEGYRLKELGKNQFKHNEMFAIADYFNENIGEIFLPTKYTKRKLMYKEKIHE
ncbi:helix-turn-helix transcriptional regulator [Staphylococcus xylosus]|uniref:helix-turn-helix transcriptional regulator n=1 Tax=Staphylococcus xylosus TaxID=1288 RepID=UPI003F54EAE0